MKSKKKHLPCGKKISRRVKSLQGGADAGILKELVLLKADILTLFVMAKDLVLKYYPDADVPNKNVLIKGLIKMAETVQELVCHTAEVTQSIICRDSNDNPDNPDNVKDLVCKNARKLTELTCSNMSDILSMLDRLSKTHLSETVIDVMKGDSDIYLPS